MNFFDTKSDCNSESLVPVAIALIYQKGRFLMQLRDNIPTILYPGIWGLFGGHLEPGESPEDAVTREIQEEINYLVEQPKLFGRYSDNKIVRHVFHFPLLVEMEALKLGEGWDFGLLTLEDINRGYCYSQQAGEARPIGQIHRQIILDFIESPLYQKK